MISGLKNLYEEKSLNLRMISDKALGKKIIILDIEEISFIPYIYPIFKSLKQKTDKISYYISTHYRGNRSLEKFDVPINKQFDVCLSRKFSKADIFLSPHIYGKGHKDTLKIHINHNQPVKYESYQKQDFVNYDIHFLTSPLHREQTENTINKYKLENLNIRLFDIGYAKSDELLNGKYNRNEVLNELKLDPDKKTVLYAPSWDEGLSLRTQGEGIINEILKTKNINFIVKLHPISYCPENGPNYLFYTGGINWKEKLKKFESYKNFRHISEGSIDELLAASDVMVTDLSSVALEFIILNKPVIYIDCPVFFEKTLKEVYSGFGDTTPEFTRDDPKANAGRHTGEVVYDIEKLPEVINKFLKNPEINSEKRIELSKKLAYNPGKAADTAALAIIKLLEL